MKVTPTGAPVPASTFNNGNSQGGDARSRAIALLQQGQSTPVQNQSAISPEEAAVVKKPAPQAAPAPVAQEPEVTEPTPAPEEPQVSAKFEELAKREKALRAQQIRQDQATKAREEALAKREAELEAKSKQYETEYIPKSRLKQDALSALGEAGVDYDALTQQFLDNQQPQDPRIVNHIQKLEAKIQELEAKTGKFDEDAKAQQKQQYDAAVRQITSDTNALVNTDPSFEMIKATDSVSEVVKLIEAEYHETGKLLSVSEAARLVEEELLEQEIKRVEKLSKLEKVQKRLKPVAPEQAATETKQSPAQDQQQQTVKTLTNGIASTRQLSNRERAMLAFKGEKAQ